MFRIPERTVRPGNVVWVVEDGKLWRREIDVAYFLEDGVLANVDRPGLGEDTHIVAGVELRGTSSEPPRLFSVLGARFIRVPPAPFGS